MDCVNVISRIQAVSRTALKNLSRISYLSSNFIWFLPKKAMRK